MILSEICLIISVTVSGLAFHFGVVEFFNFSLNLLPRLRIHIGRLLDMEAQSNIQSNMSAAEGSKNLKGWTAFLAILLEVPQELLAIGVCLQ